MRPPPASRHTSTRHYPTGSGAPALHASLSGATDLARGLLHVAGRGGMHGSPFFFAVRRLRRQLCVIADTLFPRRSVFSCHAARFRSSLLSHCRGEIEHSGKDQYGNENSENSGDLDGLDAPRRFRSSHLPTAFECQNYRDIFSSRSKRPSRSARARAISWLSPLRSAKATWRRNRSSAPAWSPVEKLAIARSRSVVPITSRT